MHVQSEPDAAASQATEGRHNAPQAGATPAGGAGATADAAGSATAAGSAAAGTAAADAAAGSADAESAAESAAGAAAGATADAAGAGSAAGGGGVVVAGWVEPEWWGAPICDQVRALMVLDPGPVLVAALAGLPGGPCPHDHRELGVPGRPVPGSAPGFACACQLVTAAAWDALTTWAGTCAAVHLSAIAGGQMVTVVPAGAPVAARTVDPIRTELAPMWHLSPASAGTRLHQGRTLTAHPDLVTLCTTGVLTAAAARGACQVVCVRSFSS